MYQHNSTAKTFSGVFVNVKQVVPKQFNLLPSSSPLFYLYQTDIPCVNTEPTVMLTLPL